jgi:hypothetical protein
MKSRFSPRAKIKALIKKKKKKGRNGDDYGQIPTGNGAENPVGGN